MITAASAVAVGVAALFVSYDQAKAARQQAALMEKTIHASTWPAIQVQLTTLLFDDSAEISYTVSNAGVGPAVVYGMRIEATDADVPDMNVLMELAPPELADLDPVVRRRTITGTILSPDREEKIMSANWQFEEPLDVEQIASFDQTFRAFRTLKASVCYCSVQQQCWIAAEDSRGFPDQTQSCEDFEGGQF